MLNANTQIQIPVLVSNKGYGLFWDNYSTTDFAGNVAGNTQYSFSSETGDLVDYYFFYGPTIDQVIANYRVTTGAAPLFPKWAYGLFQSKDHYQSSSELLSVEQGYRNNNIPVDVIVQDWQYWSPYVWGSQLMDPSRYPDPAGLVNQLHAANVHTMISIWPLYQTRNPATAMVTGELDPYNALNAINALYPDTTSGGLYHFYDTFNSMARTLSYQYDHDRLLAKYGWDAIWADNTEPQSYPEGVNVHAATTALGKGAFYINAYPLEHNRGIYEGWRSIGPNNKRVYILTRSAFAGQQRYAAGAWSGDINATASRVRRADPGRPQLRHLRDALLDHRHRRLLRNAHRGAVHALVSVRRLLPDLPYSRPGSEGALRLAVERDGQGQPAGRRQPALPADALHLFAGLDGDEPGVHDHAAAGVRLPERHEGLRHHGPVHVRPCVAGQSGDRDRGHQPIGLSAGRDLVRFLCRDRRRPAAPRARPAPR